jgi:hypothetical protein
MMPPDQKVNKAEEPAQISTSIEPSLTLARRLTGVHHLRVGRSQRGLRDDHLRRVRRRLLDGVRRNHQNIRPHSHFRFRRLPQHHRHRRPLQLVPTQTRFIRHCLNKLDRWSLAWSTIPAQVQEQA